MKTLKCPTKKGSSARFLYTYQTDWNCRYTEGKVVSTILSQLLNRSRRYHDGWHLKPLKDWRNKGKYMIPILLLSEVIHKHDQCNLVSIFEPKTQLEGVRITGSLLDSWKLQHDIFQTNLSKKEFWRWK